MHLSSVSILFIILSLSASAENTQANDPAHIAVGIANNAIGSKLPKFTQAALSCLKESGLEGYRAQVCQNVGFQGAEPFADLSRTLYAPAIKELDALKKRIDGNPENLNSEERAIRDAAKFLIDICRANDLSEKEHTFFRGLPDNFEKLKSNTIEPLTPDSDILTEDQALLLSANPAFRFGAEADRFDNFQFGLSTNTPLFLYKSTYKSGAYKFNISPEISLEQQSSIKHSYSNVDKNVKLEGRLLRYKLIENNSALRRAMIEDQLFQHPSSTYDFLNSASHDQSMTKFAMLGDGDDIPDFSKSAWADMANYAKENEEYFQQLYKAQIPELLKSVYETNSLFCLEDGTFLNQKIKHGKVTSTLGLNESKVNSIQTPTHVKVEMDESKSKKDPEGFFTQTTIKKNYNSASCKVKLTKQELVKKGLSIENADRLLKEIKSRATGQHGKDREKIIARAILESKESIASTYKASKSFMGYRKTIFREFDNDQKLLSNLLGTTIRPSDTCEQKKHDFLSDIAAHRRAVTVSKDPETGKNMDKLALRSKIAVSKTIYRSTLSAESKKTLATRANTLPLEKNSVDPNSYKTRIQSYGKMIEEVRSNLQWPLSPGTAKSVLENVFYKSFGNQNYNTYLSANAHFDAETTKIKIDAGFAIPEATSRHKAFVQFVVMHELGHALSQDFSKKSIDGKVITVSSESSILLNKVKACIKSTTNYTGTNPYFEEDFADMIGSETLANAWELGNEDDLTKAQFLQDILSGICNPISKGFNDNHTDNDLRYLRFLTHPKIGAHFKSLVATNELKLSSDEKKKTKDCGAHLWPRK